MSQAEVGLPSGAVPAARAQERLHAELIDFSARLRPGGLFYLFGWLFVAAAGGAWSRQPLLVSGWALLLAVCAGLRFLIRPARIADAAALRRAGLQLQAIVLLTAAVWSGLVVWVLLDPVFVSARPAATLCSVFFATAFAHAFPMYPRLSMLGLWLVYLPGVLWATTAGDAGATRFVLILYSAYLVSALLRSRRDYLARLGLEEELRGQRDLFRRLSQIDGLTGLLNRGESSGRIQAAYDQQRARGGRCALLLIDVDHFKQVNDRYGHAAGDRCLIALAERLRSRFESVPGSAIGRWGGEEFVVLLPATSEAAARIAAQGVLEDLAQTPLLPESPGTRVSIGVGELLPRHATPEAWIGEVDRALYVAKETGRARVCSIPERLGVAE